MIDQQPRPAHDPAAPAPPAEIRLPLPNRPARSVRSRAAMPARNVDPHVHHVREHLERLKNGVTCVAEPEQVFLGHCDDECFWELIGFRLHGHPSLIFAAVRFPRLDLPGLDFGRESLASYISAPSAVRGDLGAPPGAFPVLLPRDHETIPRFLDGLRAGRTPSPVCLESAQIELAFDLRLTSPAAVETLKRRAGPLVSHLFRTARGHVLRGRSHGPLEGPNRRQRFISVSEVQQLTPRGRFRLPALVLNRSFVTLTADVGDRETDLAAAHWVPFSPRSASGAHLLAG